MEWQDTLLKACRGTAVRKTRDGEKEKEGISLHNATMPPQIHHITDVPTEHGILSASAASILAWLHPPSRLPGMIFVNTKTKNVFRIICSSDPCGF